MEVDRLCDCHYWLPPAVLLAVNCPVTRTVVDEVAGGHWHSWTEIAAGVASRCRIFRRSRAGRWVGSSERALLEKSLCHHMQARFGPAGPGSRMKAELVGRRWLGLGGLQKVVFVGRVSGSVIPSAALAMVCFLQNVIPDDAHI